LIVEKTKYISICISNFVFISTNSVFQFIVLCGNMVTLLHDEDFSRM